MFPKLMKYSLPPFLSLGILAFSGAVIASSHMEGHRADRAQKMAVHFAEMDANNDGRVTQDEMKAHHKMRAKAADKNGDDKINLKEFKSHAVKRAEAKFARLDRNGDGFLTDADRPDHSNKMGDRMFKRMDKNGDGALSLDEMQSMRHHRGHHDRDD